MKILKNSEEEVFYKSYLDTEINCIRTTWIGYVNLNNVKAGCLAGLDLLQKHKCPYIINDNANLTGPWQKANEWIETVWMPQAIESGLHYFAHVISPDIFGQLSAKDLEKKTVGTFNMGLFENIEQAKVWIEEARLKDSRSVS